MKDREINHLFLASIINIAIVSWLVKFSWDGNDKAIVILIFYYPLLILVNFITWMTLHKRRHSAFKVYRITTIMLIVLFLPTLLIATAQ